MNFPSIDIQGPILSADLLGKIRSENAVFYQNKYFTNTTLKQDKIKWNYKCSPIAILTFDREDPQIWGTMSAKLACTTQKGAKLQLKSISDYQKLIAEFLKKVPSSEQKGAKLLAKRS